MNEQNLEILATSISKKMRKKNEMKLGWCLYLRSFKESGNDRDASIFIAKEAGFSREKAAKLVERLYEAVVNNHYE